MSVVRASALAYARRTFLTSCADWRLFLVGLDAKPARTPGGSSAVTG